MEKSPRLSAVRLLLQLLALCVAAPLWGAAGPGQLCVPNAGGEGWDCDPQSDEVPPFTWNQIAPVATPASAPLPSALTVAAGPSTEQAPLRTAPEEPETDAVTGLSNRPQDWYTPSVPRPVERSHQLADNLAQNLYVVDVEDQGGVCPGGYQPRAFTLPRNVDDETLPIVILTDSLSSIVGESASLSGNVTIEQGNRLLRAATAELDYASQIAQFPAGLKLDQPGLIMQGDQATVHMNTKQADLSGAQFILTDADLRGQAATLSQSPTGDLTLQGNQFTRCEPGNNGWVLQTKELVIEKDAVFGTAKHAVLKLKSVPVFYTPRLQFPVSDERLSGFLFPNLGYSDEDGLDLALPYYFNLAPDYDATLIPRYISRRGAGAELELRHMSAWQNTTLSGGLLPGDDLYNGELNREDFDEAGGTAVLGPFESADRWLGAIDHQGRIGAFRTLIDYTSVSDRDYFRDLGSDLGVSSRRELERKGEIQYNQGGLFMRLWAQRFQRLDESVIDDYQRLPELEASYTTPIAGPLSFSLNAKWSDFDRDTDGLAGIQAFTGQRTHVEPRLRLSLQESYGFLNLMGGYRYTRYDLEQADLFVGGQLLDDSPDRNIGVASVDGGLFFERDLNWFGQSLIQTLEPRLFYLWQEFDDQSALPLFDASRLTFGYSQLFRDNRFSGLDRIGDADQLSAGVTTRFIATATGREYFRFSVGEIFYFDDRRVTLAGAPSETDLDSSSAIAAEMAASIYGNWKITGNMVWNPHANKVDEGGAGVSYQRDYRHIFNIGYRNRFEQNIEQTDLSFYWPVTRHYAVLARWNYDLESGRTIEAFGGVEYADCCLQVRLMARRFLDSPTGANFENIEADNGVFLQIVFKGLAGFGTQVESVLEQGIRGYRTPEARDFFTN
ncbi:MAG: LPS-assembly protein LptD [bacterium]